LSRRLVEGKARRLDRPLPHGARVGIVIVVQAKHILTKMDISALEWPGRPQSCPHSPLIAPRRTSELNSSFSSQKKQLSSSRRA
jgi:hypothetical protein